MIPVKLGIIGVINRSQEDIQNKKVMSSIRRMRRRGRKRREGEGGEGERGRGRRGG